MFRFAEPDPDLISRFLSAQEGASFTYSELEATRKSPPPGYIFDHNRIQLGNGMEVMDLAVEALRSWRQFDLGWVRSLPAEAPIKTGTTVVVLVRHFGFWSLNAARIVYVLDEAGPPRRYGFAYGTLPDHAECGEEKFTIELDADGAVWYDIQAFSKPQHLMARLGFPLARLLQRRFARDSLAAMAAAIKGKNYCSMGY